MSHDRNGTLLKRGDIVTVEFFIKELYPGEDYCNVTLVSTAGRKPDGYRETLTGNAAVCVL